jgi:hypothetical protein
MNEAPPVNPYAAPQAPVVAETGGGQFQYKPLGGRAVAVAIPLGVYCLFALLAIVMGVGAGSAGLTVSEAWQDESPFTANDLVEFLEGLTTIATIIALCFFLPQANRNSRALSGLSLRFSPASTMWWYFVPFLNLVRPYQAVREIWQASTPGPHNAAWFVLPSPPWLPLWWGTWLVFNVLTRLTEVLARRAGDAAEGMSSAEITALLARLTGIVAAACLIWAVRRIAGEQAKRQYDSGAAAA